MIKNFLTTLIKYKIFFKTGMVFITAGAAYYSMTKFYDFYTFCHVVIDPISEEVVSACYENLISIQMHKVLYYYHNIPNPSRIQVISNAFLHYLNENKFDSMVISPEGGLEIGISFSDFEGFKNSEIMKDIGGNGGNMLLEMKKELRSNQIKLMAENVDYAKLQKNYKNITLDLITKDLQKAKMPMLENAKTIMTSHYTWYFIGSVALVGTCVALCYVDIPPHIPNFPRFPK